MSGKTPKPGHQAAGQGSMEKGTPVSSPETVAEQARKAQASSEAKNAESSNRDRMVDIGRANQQAGRHTT